jgi:hypothetical protein
MRSLNCIVLYDKSCLYNTHARNKSETQVAGNNIILARKKTKVKIASLGRLFLSISLFLPSQRERHEQALIFLPTHLTAPEAISAYITGSQRRRRKEEKQT